MADHDLKELKRRAGINEGAFAPFQQQLRTAYQQLGEGSKTLAQVENALKGQHGYEEIRALRDDLTDVLRLLERFE